MQTSPSMALQSLAGIRRVAIIGAGPTGVAFAKYLLAENSFAVIDVFEQRKNVGGVWNLSGTGQTRRIPIPQINPNYGSVKSCASANLKDQSLEFESPLYDYLETNIPKTMMAYSDLSFSDRLPLYPKHDDVLAYLEAHAQPVKHLIRFDTQVVDLKPLKSSPNDTHESCSSQRWNLVTKNRQTNITTEAQYDAVVVSNGHYTVPHIPFVPGLAAWNKKYPGVVVHSKTYRKPEVFKDKKVMVIGNSASGLDIAGQIAAYAQQPVYVSSRSTSQLAPSGGGPTWRKDISEIEEYLVDQEDRAARTRDGEVVQGFDAIIYATGYFYSFPFFDTRPDSSASSSDVASPSDSSDSLTSAPSPDAHTAADISARTTGKPSQNFDCLQNLTTSGLRVHDIYKHFIHIEHPTLALPVLNLKVVPFPLAENQAAVVARLWSGRLDLPSKRDMRDWETKEEERLLQANRLRPTPNTATGDSVAPTSHDEGSSRLKHEGGFHTLTYPEDAAQINSLYQWSASARPKDGLENDGIGKLGTRWNEYQVWKRKQFPDIKAAYTRLGDQRSRVTSLDELGEEWKNGYETWLRNTSQEDQRDLFRRAAIPGY